jgi:YD repeat-containing protein
VTEISTISPCRTDHARDAEATSKEQAVTQRHKLIIFSGLLTCVPQLTRAAETVTYSYDALGRLIKTVRSGGPASGVDASTQFDFTGNRDERPVAGARSNIPPKPNTVITVPLEGIGVLTVGGGV